jgi:DNA repair protein RecN (Recombination protein N)
MLQSIYIKNFVLIKELSLDFSQGFSVITGETGAGKSILLGALNMVLGARADSKQISEGAEKCIIEAVFNIESYQLEGFFAENDLDYSTECVLRRELHKSGKTRQFLNDSPVSASVLKTLSALFIDIHSQHQNLLLKDSKFQLKVVDTYAHNEALLEQYQQAYKTYQQISKELEETIQRTNEAKAEMDYLQYQFDQLEQAKLQDGELEALEAENEVLEHAGDIKMALHHIATLLQDETGVLTLLKQAENKANQISSFATCYQQWA